MTDTIIEVASREMKRKPSQLRESGLLPANIYGADRNSTSIEMKKKNFISLYENSGDTGLVYLKVDGKKKVPALIDDVQYHPVSGEVIHAVFREVDLKDKITAEVPVEIIGEFDVTGAVLVTLRDTIEVEALPTDLPEKFEVFAEDLTEIGDAVALQDLKYNKSAVEIIVGEEGLEEKIVLVQEVKEEVVEEESDDVDEEEGTESETEEGKSSGQPDDEKASDSSSESSEE